MNLSLRLHVTFPKNGKVFLNGEGSSTTKVKCKSSNIVKLKDFHKYVGNKIMVYA